MADPGVLGIVASTHNEAHLMLDHLDGESQVIQNKWFYRGLLKGHLSVAISICGVGKSNAAHGTTLLIERFRPDFIYAIGVAGAYPSSGLPVGAVVLGDTEVYGDEGLALQDGFFTLETIRLPLVNTGGIKRFNEFSLSIPSSFQDVRRGTFVTVSTCTGTLNRGMEIESRFDALCENMEGAAIAHIGTLCKVPVAEMRGISNIIADRTAAPLNKYDIVVASENVQSLFLERLILTVA